MKLRIRKILKYIFPILISIVLLYWRYGDILGSSEIKIDDPNQRHYVKTLVAKKEKYIPSLAVYGIFEPSAIVEVPVKYSGTIDRYFIEEGDYVKINQPLFKMNTSLLQLEYEKQQKSVDMLYSQVKVYREKYKKSQIAIKNKFNEFKKLRNMESRYKLELSKLQDLLRVKKELYNEGAISGEELKNLNLEYNVKNLISNNSSLDVEISLLSLGVEDISIDTKDLPHKKIESVTVSEFAELSAMESSFKLAEMQLRTLEDSLRNSTILSPIEGRILKLKKNAGEFIQAQTSGSIISIGIVNSLYAVFSVGEKDTNLIKKGNIVTLKTDVYGDREWKGIVKSIYPLYEEKSFSSRIKVDVKNENLLLHPGNFFRGNLYHGLELERILLPSDIIIGEDFVYIVKNDKAFRKKIKYLPLGNGNIEIYEGISDGDEVIIEGKNILTEGMIITRK